MPRRFAIIFVVLAAGCGGGHHAGGAGDCPAPIGTIFDADGDLLTDVQEAALGTNPARADSDGDGFSDYVEVSAGTDPLAQTSKPSGAVASLKTVASANDLIGGPGAQGAVGDWLLQNDRIHAIVQRIDARQMQVGTVGGNLIDADVLRPVGEPGNDRLGMIIPYVSLAMTSRPDQVEVVSDGSDGGAVDLRVCGVSDTFQYLDLSATFDEFLGAGSLAYDSNAVQPARISNDYILAPGSDVVEIVTTFENRGATFTTPIGDVIDSGAAEEIYNTNSIGFGAASFSTIATIQPPTKYMGFVGPGSSWGYLADGDPDTSVTVAGVSVFIQGFSSALGVIGSDPDGDPGPGMYRIKKGGRLSYHRGIVIKDGSDGVAPIAAEYYRRHDPAATLHAGTVADVTGAPVPGARIAILTHDASSADADRLPVVTAEADSAGNYSAVLPAGSYWVLADAPGHDLPSYSTGALSAIQTKFANHTIPATLVTLADGDALPDVTFPRAGLLLVDVTEVGTGTPVPSRIEVTGTGDPSPDDNVFRDQKDVTTSVFVAQDISPDGSFAIPIEPGSYTVTASHGLEWSAASQAVVVGTSGASSVALGIGQVVDTTGWLSGDYHVHMINSPDSTVPVLTRTIDAAAEGLDLLVTTDHDFVTDLRPLITQLGLGAWTSSLPGEEVTTWDMGHFQVYPLTPDPNDAAGGAYKWAGDPTNGPVSHKTVQQMFDEMDAANPGTQVRQINHPRGFRLQCYYTAIGLDTATLSSTIDGPFLRVPAPAGATPQDTKLFYPGFDAQEIQTGAKFSTAFRNANTNDFFTLLDHGLQIMPIGDSDTHSVYSVQLGFPRTYLPIADDVPANVGANSELIAGAIQAGKGFWTDGPFVLETVAGSGGVLTEPGGLARPVAGGALTVSVSLDMPEWVEVDTVKVYVNTPNTTAAPTADGNQTAPVPQYSVPVTVSPVSLGNGLKHNVAVVSVPITVSTAGDSWIVVTADAENAGTKTLFPVVPWGTSNADGILPFAMVAPVYVDGNGDGAWTAPGVTLTAGFHPPAGEPPRTWKKGTIPAQPDEDVRAQFQRVMAGHLHPGE